MKGESLLDSTRNNIRTLQFRVSVGALIDFKEILEKLEEAMPLLS